jgi:hypothetical protein
VLERRHLLHTDLVGELGDQGHVAERGAPGPNAVERGRQLAQPARQTHAVGARLPGHGAVIAQPGGCAATPIRQGSVGAIKTVEAAEEFGFEPIGSPPDADQIFAQRVGGQPVNGLVDECIDRLIDMVTGIRNGERFHDHILPNICSLPHVRNTDKRCPSRGYSHSRQ